MWWDWVQWDWCWSWRARGCSPAGVLGLHRVKVRIGTPLRGNFRNCVIGVFEHVGRYINLTSSRLHRDPGMMVTNAPAVFLFITALTAAEASWGSGTFITPSLQVFMKSKHTESLNTTDCVVQNIVPMMTRTLTLNCFNTFMFDYQIKETPTVMTCRGCRTWGSSITLKSIRLIAWRAHWSGCAPRQVCSGTQGSGNSSHSCGKAVTHSWKDWTSLLPFITYNQFIVCSVLQFNVLFLTLHLKNK